MSIIIIIKVLRMGGDGLGLHGYALHHHGDALCHLGDVPGLQEDGRQGDGHGLLGDAQGHQGGDQGLLGDGHHGNAQDHQGDDLGLQGNGLGHQGNGHHVNGQDLVPEKEITSSPNSLKATPAKDHTPYSSSHVRAFN